MKRLIQFAALIGLGFIFPSQSFAAWTAVGCTPSSNNPQFGSTTVTQTYTGGSGSLLVIGGGTFSGSIGTAAISVSGGPALSAPLTTAASADVVIVQRWVITDGNPYTYTVTLSVGGNPIIGICEYSNTGTITQDGAGATYNSGGISVSTVPTTQTSAASGELAVQFSINDGGGGTFSCTGGTNHGLGPFNGVFNACDNTSISSGSVTLTTSWTGTAFPAAGTMQFFTAAVPPTFQPEEDFWQRFAPWTSDNPVSVWGLFVPIFHFANAALQALMYLIGTVAMLSIAAANWSALTDRYHDIFSRIRAKRGPKVSIEEWMQKTRTREKVEVGRKYLQ